MENFKTNFITPEVEKPLAELQELTNLVKKKKAEVKKAMFYAKHPDLLEAKKEYDAKMAVANTDKFNDSIQVKEEVKEAPAPVKEPVKEPVKSPAPAPAPVLTPVLRPAPVQSQHAHKPLVVGMNGKWF